MLLLIMKLWDTYFIECLYLCPGFNSRLEIANHIANHEELWQLKYEFFCRHVILEYYVVLSSCPLATEEEEDHKFPTNFCSTISSVLLCKHFLLFFATGTRQ